MARGGVGGNGILQAGRLHAQHVRQEIDLDLPAVDLGYYDR